MQRLKVTINDAEVVALDFSYLSTRCKYTALMPQWDFLNFLAAQAKRYANFQLLMNTEAIGPIEKSGRVVGVEAKTEQSDLNVYADSSPCR